MTLPTSPSGFKQWYAGAKTLILGHKIISTVLLLVLFFIGWRVYASVTNSSGMPSYVLGTAQTGTLIVSVSATGQVSATNQLTLTPQGGAAGAVTYIAVADGQTVRQGQLIAEIDPTTAQKQVRDAKVSLQNAQLSLQKLQEPATLLSLTQAQDAITKAQSSLTSGYSTSVADLANTFLDLPSIMSGLQDVDFGSETNHSLQWNIDFYENGAAKYDTTNATIYRNNAYTDYNTAKTSYDATLADYNGVNLATANASTTEHLLSETYATIELVTNAVNSANALIQFYSDQLTANNLTVPSIATTQITSLASYTSKLSSHSSSLLSDSTTITNDKETITENTQSLQQLQQGTDPLSIQSAQLSIQTAQNSLQDAQATLADYYITAPFDGTVALSITPQEQVNSGTTIATLVTSQQIATVTLNEVDATNVKVGNNATLTFGAVSGLTIAGKVEDISPIGTVSQGVVSYTVKIGFATEDARVKPGMSVAAAIDTNVVSDVLMVPSAAVHTSGGSSYVLLFNPSLASSTATAGNSIVTTQIPQEVTVTTGASNTTQTQITAGLSDGEQIIVRTVSSSNATTPTPAASATTRGGFGGGGGGGIFLRGG